jgi:glycosyltransferase involved in cell wall biosynthesis
MKKILYVTTVSLTLNTFLIPHMNHLIRNGFIVEAASNIDVPFSKEFLDLDINHTKVNFSRNPINPINIKAYREIVKLQREKQFDIVNVHTPVAAFITRLALRNSKVKVVYTAHGFHFYKGAPIINWLLYYPLERLAARWTDVILTINKEDLERAKCFTLRNCGQVYLISGVGIEETKYYIENFHRNSYRENLNLKEEEFVILVLAELNKNKNHIQIIKAMYLLQKQYPKIKVLFAGRGPLEKKLRKIVEKLKLNNNINFIGFRNDIPQLLHSCDCIGLFSYREGLGKCLLEGMLLGKPLIATNTRGARELICHGDNGFLVELGDYRELSEYIEKIYKDESLKKHFKENSKSKITKYIMNNVLKEIINFY